MSNPGRVQPSWIALFVSSFGPGPDGEEGAENRRGRLALGELLHLGMHRVPSVVSYGRDEDELI